MLSKFSQNKKIHVICLKKNFIDKNYKQNTCTFHGWEINAASVSHKDPTDLAQGGIPFSLAPTLRGPVLLVLDFLRAYSIMDLI